MFIHRLHKRFKLSDEYSLIEAELDRGNDATFALSQSARPLMIASLWSHRPRPCVVVVSGEEHADRVARILSSWVGREYVFRYPERKDLPWSDIPCDGSTIGARMRAIYELEKGNPCIVVASAHALLRRVPPVGTRYFEPLQFTIGDEVAFDSIGSILIEKGYAHLEQATEPGSFCVHGDAVDIFPAQATNPVRIEFFGDEIDRIRSVVVSTGQTIQDLESIKVLPAREYAFTDATVTNARKALYSAAQEESKVAADLELIIQRAQDPTLEKYLPELYGHTANPLDHIASDALICLAEPRALFDDCLRSFEEISAKADAAHINIEKLYTSPAAMDFGKQQRLSLASLMRSGSKATASLQIRQPAIAGSDSKLMNRIQELLSSNQAVCFAVPDRGAREHLKERLLDEKIPFVESLMGDKENRTSILEGDSTDPPTLQSGVVTFTDIDIPAGSVIPSARVSVLSVADLQSRHAKHGQVKRIDPTEVSFPYKPGDYVVHAIHGIAQFNSIVRQDIAGKERDYFLLEYAAGDKLYVPFEQVDKLSRYVGPDSKSPRLTRLNTADWSRAVNKARKSAKKLAFDLVDLYTRRSTVLGHSFMPDTPSQDEMEMSFGYDLTKDQSSAMIDIKSDMESNKPMDRLLCGDVGFGKTEIALRAAFKCTEDNRQVMVLCPTTILAEQHYETFFKRFAPFEKKVAVLSRFVTPAKQRKTLQEFAEGKVDVLVGTHKLLSSEVNPYNLGLVIVDEEQKFGVQHKEQLKNMREQVDFLTLSATPIPRTMQMALSGVRDMSLIMTPPPGRKPVEVYVGEYNPDVVADAIRREIEEGGQVYYVFNRVNAIDFAFERVHEIVPEARIGIAHGQMSARQVEDIMMQFEAGDIDVLIATTIIESGIDNPRSNTLIIEDSHRLGLAQLYQLKGRVGRGHRQAYAYFMFPETIPLTEEATERLTAINEYQELGSGMKIAMRDLEIRGAGSLMGAEQHGNLSSVGFDLFTQMLTEAVSEARGEVADLEAPEVQINLPADFYLSEEYVPDVDKRVLVYRKLACAPDLRYIEECEQEIVKHYGELPQPALNLFNRARIRVRGQRLGVSNISIFDTHRIMITGIEIPKDLVSKMKAQKAIIYPQTKKLAWPYYSNQDEVVSLTLSLLEMVGGDDE